LAKIHVILEIVHFRNKDFLLFSTKNTISGSMIQKITGEQGIKKWWPLAQSDFSWWEQDLDNGLREQVQHRDLCTLGFAWGDGSRSGNGGTFEWVDLGKGSLPRMEALKGACNDTVHSFISNWIMLRTDSEGGWCFTSQTMKSPTTFSRKVPQKSSH
jgi:hypothetical protein